LCAYWLIFIVNMRTDTWIHNLCDVSTSKSGQFVTVKNKLTSVFHVSVLLLTMNFEFCHNIVKVVCGSTATLTMLWWHSWSITGHMHEKLMSICKFWLFNEINLWSYLWSWSWVIQYFILLIFILAVELLNTDFAMYFPRCLNYFLFSVNFL